MEWPPLNLEERDEFPDLKSSGNDEADIIHTLLEDSSLFSVGGGDVVQRHGYCVTPPNSAFVPLLLEVNCNEYANSTCLHAGPNMQIGHVGVPSLHGLSVNLGYHGEPMNVAVDPVDDGGPALEGFAATTREDLLQSGQAGIGTSNCGDSSRE